MGTGKHTPPGLPVRHTHSGILLGASSPLLTEEGGFRRLTRSEKHEESAGDRLMALYGFEIFRLSQARASRQTPGIPDRLYMHESRGLAVFWEAKREGGKQSRAQQDFQRFCKACGIEYVLGTTQALLAWITSHIGKR